MSTSPQPDGPGPAATGLARAGYLGPEGTFSEEALLAELQPGAASPTPLETIYDTAMALRRGDVEWAILPIENSLDGSVTVTLDLLAEQAEELEIVGEVLLAVRHALIAAEQIELSSIARVLTHPQVPGQCRRFLRERIPQAQVVATSSTADAVRVVATSDSSERVAAIGTKLAAEIYGAAVLEQDIQDSDDNVTRFVWLGRRDEHGPGGPPPVRLGTDLPAKTSIVFWGPGADKAGWLVLCLSEFAKRAINLTKIESRPRRQQMGHYMFFVDLEGDVSSPPVVEALAGLRELCEQVRVLGCYPAAQPLG